MKQAWMALSLAAVMALGLTACNKENDIGSGTGAASADKARSWSYNGVTGRVSGTAPYTGYDRRTAYDYLNDGAYQADGDGWVNSRAGTAARDLTRDARDMVRNAGRDIENAVR